MESGTLVKLKADQGRIIERRVVAVRGDVIVVCKDDEFEAAQREGREPLAVGFPVSAVVATA